MNIKLISLLTMASSLLTNCGGSAGGAAGAVALGHNSYSAATATDLPTCDATHLSELWYVESTSAFQVCKAAGWDTITMGMSIVQNKRCGKTTGGVTFVHQVTTFNTGDKYVMCAITEADYMYSNNVFFMVSQSGTAAESCSVTYDFDASSYGFWQFSLSGTTRTAVYTDATSASNGETVTFADSDCITVTP